MLVQKNIVVFMSLLYNLCKSTGNFSIILITGTEKVQTIRRDNKFPVLSNLTCQRVVWLSPGIAVFWLKMSTSWLWANTDWLTQKVYRKTEAMKSYFCEHILQDSQIPKII